MNKCNLIISETVWLDEKFRSKSEVIISDFTPNKMYATVYSEGFENDMWQVMTNRISKVLVK